MFEKKLSRIIRKYFKTGFSVLNGALTNRNNQV